MTPGVVMAGPWRGMRGAGYGVRQPKLHGRLEVALPEACDADAARRGLEAVFGAFDAGASAVENPEEALAWRVVEAYFALHAGMRVPVFHRFRVHRLADPPAGAGAAFHVAVPCMTPALAHEALGLVVSAVSEILARTGSADEIAAAFAPKIAGLRERLKHAAPQGINTFHMLRAADAMNVDAVAVLGDTYRFGQGSAGRLIQSTLSDGASALGVALARQKWQTAQVLRAIGIPVPEHRRVSGPEEARDAAERIGYPVVVKPENQEQGRGVNAGIRDAATLADAYVAARKFSKAVLVEKHVFGDEFRFTVLFGRVVKIIQRRPGGVVGDGTHTIAALADAAGRTEEARRRSVDPTYRPVSLDEEALGMLADQSLAPDSVPAPGRFVPLRRRGNILSGGTQISVDPAAVHPDNLELAVRATRCLRLDLSGVDLILTDAARSWTEAGGAIIEVNSMPQIGVEFSPAIYEEVLGEMLPRSGRILVRLVLLMDPLASPTGEELVRLTRTLGCEAVSCRAGLWIDGRRVSVPFRSAFDAARALLSETAVRSAALVMTPDELLREGLPTIALDGVSQLYADRAPDGVRRLLRQCRPLVEPHLRARPDGVTGESA